MAEDGEIPTTSSLRKSELFRIRGAKFNDTQSIVEGSKGCSIQGIIYKIICVNCNKESNEIPSHRNPGYSTTYNYIGMRHCQGCPNV